MPFTKVPGMSVVGEFKAFLTKSNALALAIGVVIGAAVGKVVSSIVDGILMPLVGLMTPGGDYKTWTVGPQVERVRDKVTVTEGAFQVGAVLGSVLDFLIVGFVVFIITKALIHAPAPAAPTKECPQCLEKVPVDAKKCRACTSSLV